MMRFFLFRPVLLALALSAMGAALAQAAPDDEAFVREKANEALQILADKSLDHDARSEKFRHFVDEVTDVRRVARFVLGKYARGADKQKLEEFTQVFRRYAQGVYEAQLDNYSGETVTVTGSQDRKPGDSVVSSTISGGNLSEPLEVNWRVLTRHGRKLVLDVQVYGIWLALQQRTEITSVIANHGGSIDAAIAVLKERIANKDFGAAQPPDKTATAETQASH